MLQIKRLLQSIARASHIQLEFDAIPHYQLKGDPTKFQQIIVNIIMNAIDSYKDVASDGLLNHVRISCRANNTSIVIEVHDWGVGIPADKLHKIFDTFYSTKGAPKYGLGIGLAIVKQHVHQDFHGSIYVCSSSRYGTCFRIHLPGTPFPPRHLRSRQINR